MSDDNSAIPCQCGCGALITPDPRGRLRRYARGHNQRNTKHSPERISRQSAGVHAAWTEGKYEGKPRPDYTKIAGKNRGKKRPAAAVEATRKGVTEKHKRGEYDTPARKAHLAKLHATNEGASSEQMDAIRAQRDLDALRPKWRETMKANRAKWEASGELEEMKRKQRARLLGSHGFGKNKEGSLEHSAAKFWRIRSPFGEIFEFINCYEWVRQNLERFHDDRPESQMPFWKRVASGLKNIQFPRYPNSPTHYKGWTVVGSWERGDLLGRDEARIVEGTKKSGHG